MKNLFATVVLISGIAELQFANNSFGQNANYTVHEWGTFTDVQGGDGKLLPWDPLQTSELPGFVYNWRKPGLNRFATGPGVGIKTRLVTLQRMETPVMYFYSAEKMDVNVSVDFPKGLITEWYPQATQIGPSAPASTNFDFGTTLTNSRATWKNLEITPASAWQKLLFASSLPQDKSGSHYFTARKTGADFVQTDSSALDNFPAETEKFIFYRGAGSFQTPLRVSVNALNEIVLENTGDQPLEHLFLLQMKNGSGGFEEIKSLPPGKSETLPPLENANPDAPRFYSLADGQAKLGAAVHAALISAGLFDDEAAAMVNTWKDSWFAEDGVRVLYLLPRKWTDETLPLTLNPAPQNTARVMVGRAEIITPEAERNLISIFEKASADATFQPQATSELKKLGRFAEPVLMLASHDGAPTNAMNLAFELLFTTVQSNNRNN